MFRNVSDAKTLPAAVAILVVLRGGRREEKAAKSFWRWWIFWAGVVLAGWAILRHTLADAGRRARVERLMEDSAVLAAVEEHAREQRVSLAAAFRRAEKYAAEITPSPDPGLYLRVGVPLARLVLRSLYGGWLRSEGEENVPAPGGEDGVVFVMNHRSNLDYVALGYLLRGRATPSFAAGEWARFWPVGPLVRAMGSFFVRRGSGNALYRRVLERFVQTGLEERLTPAVFIEGGLSRDGRLREPKTGLLDYALRRFDPLGERDLLFVPVAINHDWVLEDGSLPTPGEPNPSGLGSVFSTVLFIVRAIRLARQGPEHLGYAAMKFGAPVSAGEWARSRNVDFRSLAPDERIGWVREFAGSLMRVIGGLVPVTPVPVVASILLETPGVRLSEVEIRARANTLLTGLKQRGAWACFGEEEAFEAALRLLVLRGLVMWDGDFYRAAPGGEKLLRFYEASISHHV